MNAAELAEDQEQRRLGRETGTYTRKRTIWQLCPCGATAAAQMLKFEGGLLVSDHSACEACSTVLYEWARPAEGSPAPKINTNGPGAGSNPVSLATQLSLF